MKLSGKVAVITGAARGIGRACAERFLKEGAKVVVSDVDADGLARTASELVRANECTRGFGRCGKTCRCRSSRSDRGKEFGRIDIMVNNAGVARNQDLLEISEKDFDDVIAINLKGANRTSGLENGRFAAQKSIGRWSWRFVSLRSGSPQNIYLSAAATSEFPPRALPATETDLRPPKQ